MPLNIFDYVTISDQTAHGGALSYALAIGDDADTIAPDFEVNGGFSQTKTLIKSVHLTDPGDTTDFSRRIVDGTPLSPSSRAAPYPGGYDYWWPYDNTGSFISAHAYIDPYAYSGRNVEISGWITENPTQTARGGAYCISVTPNGKETPIQRVVVSNCGNLVAFGRSSFEDAGVSYPYSMTGLSIQKKTAPGYTNVIDTIGWGNLSVPASDQANNGVLAIRKCNDLTTGFDTTYNFTSGEYVLNTVASGTRTPRWGHDASGNLNPVTNNGVGIGKSDRRVGPYYGYYYDILRTDDATVQQAINSAAAFSSDVQYVGTTRSASSAFNFFKGVSGFGGGSSDTKFKFRGDGNAYSDNSWNAGGAGFGEYWEWEDGNPDNEDRVGWTVTRSGAKIRRAVHGEVPIGVITARPAVIGNSDACGWMGKYLKDKWGRPVVKTVEYHEWDEPIFEKVNAERQRTVEKTVKMQKKEWVEIEKIHRKVELVNGKHILSHEKKKHKVHRPIVEMAQLHNEQGKPILNEKGQRVLIKNPVMEDVVISSVEHYTEEVDNEVGRKRHSYRSDSVPHGVTVPKHAVLHVVDELVVNKDFKPKTKKDSMGREEVVHETREDRREWGVVSYLGIEYVGSDEIKGLNWEKVRDCGDGVEEWLVR